MKKTLLVVSICCFIYSFIVLIGLGGYYSDLFVFSKTQANLMAVVHEQKSIPIFYFVIAGLVIFSLFFWLGYLLLKLKNRKTAIKLASILLLLFPYGTALGVITLCLLQTKEIKNVFTS